MANISISWNFQGQASDIHIHAEQIRRTKHRLSHPYAEHCRRSYAEFECTMDRERFMTAEEALAWGLVDGMLQTRT